MASIAVIVLCITVIITCNGVGSKPTEKYLTTRLLDVLNPPETIFPESNKVANLSSSGKNDDHVDDERKRRNAFFQDTTETIFPESNKVANLSSSGKNDDHVDDERKRRNAFFQDTTDTATATDDKSMIGRLSFNICCYCMCCPCRW